MKLLDIADLEAFCERAIQRSGITEFGYLDHDDLLAELVAFCWELSADYDPDRSKFSTYAGNCVYTFIVNWKRSQFRTRWVFKDRIYERPRPVFVGLDHRPDEADASQSLDFAASGLSDLLGLQRTRGGGTTRRDDELRQAPAREAA